MIKERRRHSSCRIGGELPSLLSPFDSGIVTSYALYRGVFPAGAVIFIAGAEPELLNDFVVVGTVIFEIVLPDVLTVPAGLELRVSGFIVGDFTVVFAVFAVTFDAVVFLTAVFVGALLTCARPIRPTETTANRATANATGLDTFIKSLQEQTATPALLATVTPGISP